MPKAAAAHQLHAWLGLAPRHRAKRVPASFLLTRGGSESLPLGRDREVADTLAGCRLGQAVGLTANEENNHKAHRKHCCMTCLSSALHDTYHAGCRLEQAIWQAANEANDHKGGTSSRHLKPIVHAVEMVFASAAALSAAFGRKVCCLLETDTSALPACTSDPPAFQLMHCASAAALSAGFICSLCTKVGTIVAQLALQAQAAKLHPLVSPRLCPWQP